MGFRTLSFLTLVLLLPLCAHAGGMDAKMEEMFDAMSTSTGPAASMGPRRGTFTGGSLQMRTRVVRPGPVIAFDPPSMKGGCGGIDLFGGSFSAISGDAFKDLGRAVASNAAGYAFELGLKALCDSCAQTMSRLGDVIRSLNFQMMDSCQLAEGIVTGDRDGALKQRSADMRSAFSQLGGAVSDVFEANEHTTPGGPTPTEVASEQDPEANGKLYAGNATWEILTEGQIWLSWGGESGAPSDQGEFTQDLLSMIGTVVSCLPEKDGCPADPTAAAGGDPVDLRSRPVPAVLGLTDLVEGSQGAIPNGINFYQCAGGLSEGCLDPRPSQRNIVGFAQRIQEHLLGPPGNPTTGMVSRYIRSEGQPSGEDLMLLGAGGDFSTMMVRMLKADEGLARDYVTEFAPQIAADALARELDRLFTQARLRASESHNPEKETVLRLINQAANKVRIEHRAISEATANKAVVMEAFRMRAESAIGQSRARIDVALAQ